MAKLDLEDLNPAFAPLLNAYTSALDKAGIKYHVESGYRTPEHQSQIYESSHHGRDQPAAPPWRSFHNYGLAADVIPDNPADYERMHNIARQAGLADARQGFGFSYDLPHVEMPGRLSDLIDQYHLANWRPKSMPAPATGAIAYDAPMGQPSRPGTPTPGPLMFGGLNANARGMRNNNPGNLEANAWTKTLPGYKGSDGRFAIFDTPQNGAAALDANLKSYGAKGINTPFGIASTWASAGDNNDPKSYGGQIAKALGVGPNDKIDMSDPTIRSKVSQAIASVENGPGNSAGVRVAYAGTADAPTTPPGTSIASTPMGPAPAGAVAPKPPDFQKQQEDQQKAQDQQQQEAVKNAPNMLDMRPDVRNAPMVGIAGRGNPAMAQSMAQSLGMDPAPSLGTTLTSIQNPLDPQAPGMTPYAQYGPPVAPIYGQQAAPPGTTMNSLSGMQAALAQQQYPLYQANMMQNMTIPQFQPVGGYGGYG